MKTLLATAALAVALLNTAVANTLTVSPDPSSPTGSLLTNSTGNLLFAFNILGAASEPVEITSFTVGLSALGGATVKNLSLWQSGSQLGATIATPVLTASFSVPFLVGQSATDVFQIKGDIGSAAGSVELLLPISAIVGTGVSSNTAYSGPGREVDGATLQVNSPTGVPEPDTLFMVALGVAAAITVRHRHKQT